ncbi:hypothetical protein OHD31_02020 [Escherichia coli]|nr:hypothetical protein [Escherichia coli]
MLSLGSTKASEYRPAARWGRFAWYDHVLSTSLLLGNVPPRHQTEQFGRYRHPVPVLVVDVRRLANLRRQRK